jgi:hypothetical protein
VAPATVEAWVAAPPAPPVPLAPALPLLPDPPQHPRLRCRASWPPLPPAPALRWDRDRVQARGRVPAAMSQAVEPRTAEPRWGLWAPQPRLVWEALRLPRLPPLAPTPPWRLSSDPALVCMVCQGRIPNRAPLCVTSSPAPPRSCLCRPPRLHADTSPLFPACPRSARALACGPAPGGLLRVHVCVCVRALSLEQAGLLQLSPGGPAPQVRAARAALAETPLCTRTTVCMCWRSRPRRKTWIGDEGSCWRATPPFNGSNSRGLLPRLLARHETKKVNRCIGMLHCKVCLPIRGCHVRSLLHCVGAWGRGKGWGDWRHSRMRLGPPLVRPWGETGRATGEGRVRDALRLLVTSPLLTVGAGAGAGDRGKSGGAGWKNEVTS